MVNLILTLLCIGALVYFVVDNIKTNKRRKTYIADEKNTINSWREYLANYINEEGWYLVVLSWYNTKDPTAQLVYAKNGYDAVRKAISKVEGESNLDFCVMNVTRLLHA